MHACFAQNVSRHIIVSALVQSLFKFWSYVNLCRNLFASPKVKGIVTCNGPLSLQLIYIPGLYLPDIVVVTVSSGE